MLAITAILLVTVWGGTQYGWGSSTIMILVIAAVVLVTAFILWERKASEPILPPSLFRVGIFRVSAGVSFLLSIVMFGAIIYLPLYLQLVDGVSAMVSGLLLVPMMVGVLVTSIASGQIVTRTGRYKVFPIAGAVLMIIGMWLLSQLGLHTSHLMMSLYVIVLGAGMGMIMQIMVLATQNAVAPTQIGTGTAAVTFFRSLGGAFGTSLFGAIFIAGLGHWIPLLVPGAVSKSIHVSGSFSMSPTRLHTFPTAVQHGILESFVRSLHTMFLVGVPVAAATFVLTLFLREVKLRTKSGLERPIEDVAMAGGAPGSADAEIDRGVLGSGAIIG
jgi:predicted MFS family arabinose efflux permease